jgi:hypothetical protein
MYTSLGDAIMIEGDVMLQGQGTDKQTLTPIMAKLPDTTSEITLEEWLALILRSIPLDLVCRRPISLVLICRRPISLS